ncbi:zinc finger MYM-type 1-like [Pelobates cultripes]|uniref:Zinc finger MYM-type 1-like n=1 Tax=Pelobates cultripes TaxID=61616 RepID=A0AAD1RIL3_PELCU|nr:zinc finger MYM-type 1-like [Pelobates cultripes]
MDMFSPHAQSTIDSIAGTSTEAANTEQIVEDEYVEETAGLSTEEQGELGHPESPTEQVIADISECQIEVLDPSFNYFTRPNRNQLAVFFKYHPQQEIPDPVLKKSVKRKDGTIRKWLSYCKIKKAMFCSVCLAFLKSHETNSFIEGMTDKRHVHQRIVEEHEKSAMHNVCAEAFFLKSSSVGVDDLLLFKQMSENISNEVREAGMFSIQVATTQDITSKDQCSIIVRYVKECIKEKLLAIVECESSTGKNLFKLVMEVLKSCKLEITKCIGSSTDGAANMQGQYNGFSSWLSTESPEQVHIWFNAHILNLVLADTTKVVVASASLFSLLNDIAVFIRDSYQRMNTWEEVSQDPHHRRISVIGETRWWSKDAALRKVLGEFSNPDSALFLSLIYTLSKIEESVSSKPEVRVRAKAYAESLLKYESILTAQSFLRIFELTTPLSKYLQTSQMDISKAVHMVQGTY